MNKPKSIHSLSDEELLASLEGSVEVETDVDWHNDVPSFITHFKLQPGPNRVRSDIIYKVYKNFSKNPDNSYNFGRTMVLFFQHEDQRYFMLDKPVGFFMSLLNKHKEEKATRFTTNPTRNRSFRKLMSDLGVKKGNTWVPASYIYEVYRCWCIDTKKRAVFGKDAFFKFLSMNLESRHLGNSIYGQKLVKIDKSFVDDPKHREVIKIFKMRIDKDKSLYKMNKGSKKNDKKEENQSTESEVSSVKPAAQSADEI